MLPDGVLDVLVSYIGGPRAAVVAGIHGVCRRWHDVVMKHAGWEHACVDEGVGRINRPDGEAVEWSRHFLSYGESLATQSKIMEAVMERKNVFMSGSGGVGKSVLIKVLAEQLTALDMNVHVVATTGMAATLIGGTTLHRWGGVGLAKEPARDLLKRMRYETRKRWRGTDVLILDEVSMLDPELFGKFDEIARILRSCHDKLFGGIQLILSGDFFQLPPVKPEGPYRFVFQHPEWEKGIHCAYILKHVYRTTDALFTEVLGRVRSADHTEEDVAILRTRLGASIPEAEDLGILPTRMYSHRGDVDGYNRQELDKLPGTAHTVVAKFVVKRRNAGGDGHIAQRQYALRYTRAESQALQQCPVARDMRYKNGAQVMLVVNLDPEDGLVNGSRGVVKNVDADGGIEVLFVNGTTRVVEPFKWLHEDARGDKGEAIKLTLTQMPLALAWAYTVHKSQGSTLDAAIMDLGPRVFMPGMSYVSLSRVRSLKAMSLSALDPTAIRADPLVKAYYSYIERNGTHKGFCATINKMVFPTMHEMRSLVRALPAIKKRRDEARKRIADAAAETESPTKRAKLE